MPNPGPLEEEGSEAGRVLYLICAGLPDMREHQEHDSDPRSEAYLEKARALQPECLTVFGGGILFSRGS